MRTLTDSEYTLDSEGKFCMIQEVERESNCCKNSIKIEVDCDP